MTTSRDATVNDIRGHDAGFVIATGHQHFILIVPNGPVDVVTQLVCGQSHRQDFASRQVNAVFQRVVGAEIVLCSAQQLYFEHECVFCIQHEFWQFSLHGGIGSNFCSVRGLNSCSVVQCGGQFKSSHRFSAQIGHHHHRSRSWQTRRASQVAHATHRQIVVHNGSQGRARQQALTNRFQACMHARCLARSEGILAFLGRVVHVILNLGTLTNGLVAALVVGTGGRGVAHFVALDVAIGFRGTRRRVVKSVIQRQVVTHLVSDGAIHVAARLQFADQTEGVVQHHNPIFFVKRWAGVGKALGASQSIVVIDFGYHKNVDVVLSVPSRQSFHVSLVCTCNTWCVSNAALCIARQNGAVHADDAIGGFAAGCSLRQFELDAGVYANAIAGSVCRLPEIVIHAFDGRSDLSVADVLGNPDGRSCVDHMNHNWQGGHCAVCIALCIGPHGHDCLPHGLEVASIVGRGFDLGLVNGISQAGLSLSLGLDAHHQGQ